MLTYFLRVGPWFRYATVLVVFVSGGGGKAA